MELDGSFWWVILISLFLLSFLFSLIRESLYYASAYKLEKIFARKRKNGFQEKLNLYLNKQEEMIWTTAAFEGLFNFGFLLVITLKFLGSSPKLSLVPFLLLFGVSFVFFIFASLLPKIMAGLMADSILYRSIRLTYTIARLTTPLIRFLKFLEKITCRLLNIGEDSEARNAQEEIIEAAREGERYGLLAKEGKKMIESLIDFTNSEASEVMVPRTEMNALDVNASIEEAAKFSISTGHSRIPVYQDNQDNIIGILYVKDLFGQWIEKGNEGTLRDILRKPYFVPETKWISALLREFKSKKVHIAIVLDEYGGTAGLITIEDILEEIVGEIDDEFDQEEKEPSIKKVSENVLEVDARIHIDQLNEKLHLELSEDEDYETLGGFVISHLGRIPRAGENFSSNDLHFSVLEADERKIIKVKITLQPSE